MPRYLSRTVQHPPPYMLDPDHSSSNPDLASDFLSPTDLGQSPNVGNAAKKRRSFFDRLRIRKVPADKDQSQLILPPVSGPAPSYRSHSGQRPHSHYPTARPPSSPDRLHGRSESGELPGSTNDLALSINSQESDPVRNSLDNASVAPSAGPPIRGRRFVDFDKPRQPLLPIKTKLPFQNDPDSHHPHPDRDFSFTRKHPASILSNDSGRKYVPVPGMARSSPTISTTSSRATAIRAPSPTDTVMSQNAPRTDRLDTTTSGSRPEDDAPRPTKSRHHSSQPALVDKWKLAPPAGQADETDGGATTTTTLFGRTGSKGGRSTQLSHSLSKSSQFSFQLFNCSVQERILEERHRQKKALEQGSDDEDDDFWREGMTDSSESFLPMDADYDEEPVPLYNGDVGDEPYSHHSQVSSFSLSDAISARAVAAAVPSGSHQAVDTVGSSHPIPTKHSGSHSGHGPFSGQHQTRPSSSNSHQVALQPHSDPVAFAGPVQANVRVQESSPVPPGQPRFKGRLSPIMDDDLYFDDGLIGAQLGESGQESHPGCADTAPKDQQFDESIFDSENNEELQMRLRLNSSANKADSEEPVRDSTETGRRSPDKAAEAATGGGLKSSTSTILKDASMRLSQIGTDQDDVHKESASTEGESDQLESYVNEADIDDSIIAAANSSVLAHDDDGFYGREFGFYPRPNMHNPKHVDGLGGVFSSAARQPFPMHSAREPRLTPITERSENTNRDHHLLSEAAYESGPNKGNLASDPINSDDWKPKSLPTCLSVGVVPPEGDLKRNSSPVVDLNFDGLDRLRLAGGGRVANADLDAHDTDDSTSIPSLPRRSSRRLDRAQNRQSALARKCAHPTVPGIELDGTPVDGEDVNSCGVDGDPHASLIGKSSLSSLSFSSSDTSFKPEASQLELSGRYRDTPPSTRSNDSMKIDSGYLVKSGSELELSREGGNRKPLASLSPPAELRQRNLSTRSQRMVQYLPIDPDTEGADILSGEEIRTDSVLNVWGGLP